jgi:hypothetical protein
MTAVESKPQGAVIDEDALVADLAHRHRSERGSYEIYVSPALASPMQPEQMTDDQVTELVGYFDYNGLIDDDNDEASVRASVGEMVRAIGPGNIVTPLFDQGGSTGMSLIHAWFGPNFPLFRHSHPKLGDCLYYIVAGSAVLGSHVLKPGDGFFVPNGMPYKYRAGPEGVEVLEFRAGGGNDDAPILKLHERSVEAIREITVAATNLREQWGRPPAHVADTPYPAR